MRELIKCPWCGVEVDEKTCFTGKLGETSHYICKCCGKFFVEKDKKITGIEK